MNAFLPADILLPKTNEMEKWAVIAAMRRTGYAPEQTCILGDRIYTDIACGVNAGIDAVFLLSGEGVMADIEKYNVHPSYVFQNIRAFLTELEKGEAV